MGCPPASIDALRVLTWNVNGLRPMLNRRVCGISKVLSDLQADVVCIQETKLAKSDMESLHTIGAAEGWCVLSFDLFSPYSNSCTAAAQISWSCPSKTLNVDWFPTGARTSLSAPAGQGMLE